MSTWQIFSDAGCDGFRWEVSGRIIPSDFGSAPTSPLDSAAPLPSMADVLLQGSSKLLEREEAATGELPMFRTGLVKGSSIAKAMSILADDKVACSACSKLQEREADGAGSLPMFRTALGKSVPLKDSSIAKALSILGDDNMSDMDDILPRERGFGSPNCLFQTGSGKKVNVSSAGLLRAKALLGLEEEDLNGFNDAKELSSSCQLYGWGGLNGHNESDAASVPSHSVTPKQYGGDSSRKQSEGLSSGSKVTPIKFQTAGGKSLLVSSDALKRARTLLGDPELGNFIDKMEADDQFFTPQKDKKSDDTALNNGNGIYSHFYHQGKTNNKHTSNGFVSPLRSSSKQFRSLVNSENLASGSNLIKKFDAAVDDRDCALNISRPAIQELAHDRPSTSDLTKNNSKDNAFSSRIKQFGSPAGRPLADITNYSTTAYANNKQANGEKKRLGRTASVSPFKRPRSSKFNTPLKKNAQHAPSGLSVLSSDSSYSKRVLSTRYPEQVPRVYIKEYFGTHPSVETKLDHLPDHIRRIRSNNADKYVFYDKSGSNIIGAEAFFQMLAESGASLQHASREWVTNHYRWIVWKLACYEKYYPAKCAGKLLTIFNVLEELKYRYEREVNYGHCSAIKRILSGDAPASSMMVLCVSAIHPNYETKINSDSKETNGAENSNHIKVELTDGWYSMDAALDVLLTKQLNAGKLFVGQKLRIWGAGLCGWVSPTSPLEAVNTICLALNMNGTYRAHWADRLGFCKGIGGPLAFSCIKSNGGPVPRTLAGITRIYPILYKERLSTGRPIVRSERMENKMVQLRNQRRLALVEGFISEYQRGINAFDNHNDGDSEEGAKVFRLLETAAEPEVIMAEMSSEQLTSFTTYKAKLEAARQTEMENSIAKALEDTGLGERDVTPFIRIRVVGLTTISYPGKNNPKEGIVTIWNPTEKQRTELTEGQIYVIEGLVPMNSDSGTLYLQARGPSTRWQPLSPKASQIFQPFFNPRKSVSLSNLGEVPLSSEFDIAASIVYVGEVYMDVQQAKQWVFVTDGSAPHSRSGEISNHHLLAISFSSPYMDDISFPHINHNLSGSTVAFCNLIKRPKDQKNDLWVSEATENSIYFLNWDSPHCSHLKSIRDSVQRWAKTSNSAMDKLRQRVLFIIGDCKE